MREKKQELEIATLDYKAAKEDLDICREKLSRLEVEHQAEGVELANLRKENRNLNALLLSKRSNEKVEKDRFAEAIRAVTVEKKKQLQQMAEENEILVSGDFLGVCSIEISAESFVNSERSWTSVERRIFGVH